MGVQVKVESHLKELFRELDRKESKALDALGMQGESNAKKEITSVGAVDTGRLRNSLTYIVDENKGEVKVGSFVSYAPYVEYGTGIYAEGGKGRQTPWVYQDEKGEWHRTHGQRATHFLRNAINNHLAEYKALIERILRGE